MCITKWHIQPHTAHPVTRPWKNIFTWELECDVGTSPSHDNEPLLRLIGKAPSSFIRCHPLLRCFLGRTCFMQHPDDKYATSQFQTNTTLYKEPQQQPSFPHWDCWKFFPWTHWFYFCIMGPRMFLLLALMQLIFIEYSQGIEYFISMRYYKGLTAWHSYNDFSFNIS